MPTISFTISSENLTRVKDAMKGLFPIPETCDSEAICTPLFTETQWAKEAVRRLVIRDIRRWEHKEAQDAIDVEADDNLLT